MNPKFNAINILNTKNGQNYINVHIENIIKIKMIVW